MPHSYRIQTQRLLIELVNAVDSGNHIHSVIRDFEHDFAEDSLHPYRERVRMHGSHLSTRTVSSETTGLLSNDWS